MHLTLLIAFLLPSVIFSNERIWIGDLVLKHVPPTTTKSSTTIGDFVLNSNPTTPTMTPLATTPITVTTNKPKSVLHLCSHHSYLHANPNGKVYASWTGNSDNELWEVHYLPESKNKIKLKNIATQQWLTEKDTGRLKSRVFTSSTFHGGIATWEVIGRLENDSQISLKSYYGLYLHRCGIILSFWCEITTFFSHEGNRWTVLVQKYN